MAYLADDWRADQELGRDPSQLTVGMLLGPTTSLVSAAIYLIGQDPISLYKGKHMRFSVFKTRGRHLLVRSEVRRGAGEPLNRETDDDLPSTLLWSPASFVMGYNQRHGSSSSSLRRTKQEASCLQREDKMCFC